MTKQQLVRALAERAKLTRPQAAKVIEALFAAEGLVAGELKKGGSVQVSGFGVFETRRRKERSGRDPRTGREIKLKASITPAFRPGKALKDLVNRRK
ncbi:MAG: HU family DNA-binding protein [Gemmatimonadota bacterium]